MKRLAMQIAAIIALLAPTRPLAAPDLVRPPSRFLPSPAGIPGAYMVVLRDDIASANGVAHLAEILATRHGGIVRQRWEHTFKGFLITLPGAAAERLSTEPWVEWVEQDRPTELVGGVQGNPPWGLDRIDQAALPLSATYQYPVGASGVHVYVIDTGINVGHPEFGYRATGNFDAIGDGMGAGDCSGHGTHVAGIVGATTYGVAKSSSLHSIRVLGCDGTGTVSGAVSGVDWVTANHTRPAIANMSLAVIGGSATLDAAVQRSIDAGVTYVVAAGNGARDACIDSPSRVGAAITVGSTTSSDGVAYDSNFGTCVDVWAPGVGILSTSHTGGTMTLSGTSMASPHVAGVAAMYLAWHGNALPSEVANQIVANANAGILPWVPAGSPNRLVFSGFIPSCSSGLELCGGTCTSLLTDTYNCGTCGKRCAGTGRKCFPGDGTWYYAGQTCSNGGCVSLPCE